MLIFTRRSDIARSEDDHDDDDDVEYDMDDDNDENADAEDVPSFDDGPCDSMCSEETTTGTPRCRRAKRQRRRRRRRSAGTLHDSMRRRFDGHKRHHHPHHHPHQHHLSSHHSERPTRVRSFNEEEFRRNQMETTAGVSEGQLGINVPDGGPKIVGTLLKPEYQRKPGLDEEICLLPPPPRLPRRHCSVSTNVGDTPSPSIRSSSPPTPTQPSVQPTVAQYQRTPAAHADTVIEWTASSNASKTTLTVHGGGGGGGIQPLRRAMTQRLLRKRTLINAADTSAPGKRHSRLTRHGSTLGLPSSRQQRHQQQQQQSSQPQRSNNASRSSVMIRNSYRHGRIIRLEQKATKVLGVVFFTFVFLWTPFFALNLLPSVCPNCEANTNKGLIDLVTWLGYASSMVNPVFYTIFNKVFRQAFKRILMCKYSGRNKRHSWPPLPAARKV